MNTAPKNQAEIQSWSEVDQLINQLRAWGIDVFYFDFYSIALSKMERGNSRDVADVKLLVQKGIIKLDELDAAYQQVLAQLGLGRYPRLIPERFAQRYPAVRQLL